MKKARIIFLCVGIVLLGLLFAVFGVKEPVRQIVDFGWKFWLCVVIYFFNQLLLSYGWMVLIPYKLKARNYIDVLLARIAGDSTTTINGAAGVAGDALKALYLKDIVPFKKGLASVVLDRMLHTVGNILTYIFGIIAAFFKLDVPLWTLIVLLVFVVALLLIIIYLLKNHHQGFIQNIVSKMPAFLKRKILTKERKPKIVELDNEIKMVFSHKKNMRHVYVSLFMHTVPVILSGTLEVYVIMYFIGGPVFFFDAMLVYIFGLLVASLAFFVPLNIGTSEGSYAIALRLLGYNPQLGIAIGMLRRLRALVWSLPGLLLLFHKGLTGSKKEIIAVKKIPTKGAGIKKKTKKS
jgi:glycosyltransferase 2 family protein